MSVTEVLSWCFLIGGTVFSVIGAIGLLRLPEFYSRVHAVGVTDTMGPALIFIGCAFQAGLSLYTVKLATAWLFIYITGPAATHALAKAAYASGLVVEGRRINRSRPPPESMLPHIAALSSNPPPNTGDVPLPPGVTPKASASTTDEGNSDEGGKA